MNRPDEHDLYKSHIEDQMNDAAEQSAVWSSDPLVEWSPNRTVYIERLRARIVELEKHVSFVEQEIIETRSKLPTTAQAMVYMSLLQECKAKDQALVFLRDEIDYGCGEEQIRARNAIDAALQPHPQTRKEGD